jgi:hypothetical protein
MKVELGTTRRFPQAFGGYGYFTSLKPNRHSCMGSHQYCILPWLAVAVQSNQEK